MLNACASALAIEADRCAHKQIIQSGWDSDVATLVGVLNSCAKSGSMENACRVFNEMLSHDVVTWNAMISGHVKCGQGQKALDLF